MKILLPCRRAITLSLALCALLSAAVFAAPTEKNNLARQNDQFLRSMGYDDISALAREKLQSGQATQDPVGRSVIELNAARYSMINDARRLASIVWAELKDSALSDAAKAERTAKLIARLLALQPEALPEEFPLNNMSDLEKIDHLTKSRLSQIDVTTRRMTADFSFAIYGEEAFEEISRHGSAEAKLARDKLLKTIDTLTKNYVDRVYTDQALGQTRFLGTMLALLALHDSRLAQGEKSALELALRKECSTRAINLDNFISTRFTIADRSGKSQTLKVENGALVYLYSPGKEAATIASSSSPRGLAYLRALMQRTMGYSSSPLFHIDPSKMLSEDRTAWRVRVRHWIAERDFANMGLSHMGQAFVFTDPATGLSHVEIRDIHPDPLFVGARVTDLTNFATIGDLRRIAVTNINADKFAKAFLNQEEFPIEASAVSVPGTADTYFSVEFGAETIEAMKKLAKEDPKAWFSQVVSQSRSVWDRMITEVGVNASYKKAGAVGISECAQAVDVCFTVSAGISPHLEKGRWRFPLNLSKALKESEEQALSPLTFFHQSGVYERPKLVELDPRTAREAELSATAPRETAFDRSLQRKVDHLLAPVRIKQSTESYRKTFAAVQKWISEENKLYASAALAKKGGLRVTNTFEPMIPSLVATTDEYEQFLERVGFVDFSSRFENAIKDKVGGLHYGMKQQQEFGIRRYQPINAARRIASKVFARHANHLMSGTINEGSFELLTEFISEMLAMQPVTPSPNVPAHLLAIKSEVKKALEAEKYFQNSALQSMSDQVSVYVSMYADLMYGPEKVELYSMGKEVPHGFALEANRFHTDIAEVSKDFATLVTRMNLDSQVGQTRWLGRALALCLARVSYLSKNPELMQKLALKLARRGYDLRNFVGNTIVLKTQSGIMSSTVQTGDLAYESVRTPETRAIIFGSLPHKDLMKRARKMGMVASFLETMVGALLPVSEESIEDGISLKSRILNYWNQKSAWLQGFSHVGSFWVPTDPETGIGQVLIYDSYPAPPAHAGEQLNRGGVRLLGLEQFGNAEEVGKFGIAHIDPEEFYKWAQKVYAKGYPETIWPATVPVFDENGVYQYQVNPERQDWKPRFTREDFARSKAIKDPIQHHRMWQQKTIEGWQELLVEGSIFKWFDEDAGKVQTRDPVTGQFKTVFTTGKYITGGFYCSQGVYLASCLKTGIPMEEYAGRWAPFMGFKPLKALRPVAIIDNNSPIIPPSSLAVQPWVTGVDHMVYEEGGFTDFIRAGAMPMPQPWNFKSLQSIQNLPELQFAVESFRRAKFNEAELDFLTDRDMHAAMMEWIASGSSNAQKVFGFKPSVVAEKLQAMKTVHEAITGSPGKASKGTDLSFSADMLDQKLQRQRDCGEALGKE